MWIGMLILACLPQHEAEGPQAACNCGSTACQTASHSRWEGLPREGPSQAAPPCRRRAAASLGRSPCGGSFSS